MKNKLSNKAFDLPLQRRGLPAWTYHNEELFELEVERIFLQNWIFIGHISEIPNPGDFLSLDLANEKVLVVRDHNGDINAFHNYCRHRASRLVCESKGNCGKALVCPFHGWTYHLDGQLKQIPRANAFPGLDKESLSLKALRCEVWHGIIFVSFNEDAKTVAECYAPAEDEISVYKIEDMQPFDQPWRYDLDFDWKSVTDIDNEGYHVAIGHPGLQDLVGNSYKDEQLSNGLSRSSGSFKGRTFKTGLVKDYVEALPDESYLPEPFNQQWIYWGLFPGLVITLFPDQVEIYQTYPSGFQTSVMAGKCYALPDARPEMESARLLNRKLNNNVGEEDIALIKWAAEGMRSSAYDGQILGDMESLVIAFHEQLRAELPVMTMEQAPRSGTLQQVNEQLRRDSRLKAFA